MNKSYSNKIFYYILIALLLVMVVFAFSSNNSTGQKVYYKDVIQSFEKNEIDSWYVVGNTKIVFKLIDEKSTIKEGEFPKKADMYIVYNTFEFNYLLEHYQKTTVGDVDKVLYMGSAQPTGSFWDIVYPILMIGLAIVIIVVMLRMFSSKGSGAMGFGKSRARAATNIKVKFSDIAGADEEKEELKEIVEFLKTPAKFTQLGARIPKGVLLVGPPGTGKTLLARAVAGESEVPFLSISGSDFVEMFVGVGASRVRDLFDQAKKNSPCIIFIDEIDAVGRQRGAGLGGSNDEREQTLNQLLVELDGFEANQGIIVLAATNRADVLDPALMRPGRFDRQVYVHAPDVKGREGIIRIHAKNKPLDTEIDFNTLARITSGFTGADIENMLNEAAILAARANRPRILMQDITEGINKVIMGPQKKSMLITEKDKKITAYHEAGHALLNKKLEHTDEVQEVSIIPRGMAGGYTMSRPDNDNKHVTFKQLNDYIASTMGGRIAEALIFKDISTGASNDIQKATEIARKMVTEWGMTDKFEFMSFDSEGQVFIGRDYQSKNLYSEKTAGDIDEEVKRILEYNYKRAQKIIADNKELLEEMAKLLIEKETIYKEEVDMLLEGKKTEEIVEFMNQRDAVRKEKEIKEKKEQEQKSKLNEMEMKVKTGEVFLKHGIITEKEFKEIQKIRDEYKKEIEKTSINENAGNLTETENSSDNKQQVEIKKENDGDKSSEIGKDQSKKDKGENNE